MSETTGAQFEVTGVALTKSETTGGHAQFGTTGDEPEAWRVGTPATS